VKKIDPINASPVRNAVNNILQINNEMHTTLFATSATSKNKQKRENKKGKKRH